MANFWPGTFQTVDDLPGLGQPPNAPHWQLPVSGDKAYVDNMGVYEFDGVVWKGPAAPTPGSSAAAIPAGAYLLLDEYDQGDSTIVPGPTGATGPTGPAGAASPGVALRSFVMNITPQNIPQRVGKFVYEPPGGFTQKQVGSAVLVQQMGGPVFSSPDGRSSTMGDAPANDELGTNDVEVDPLTCAGYVADRKRLVVYWQSRGGVRGAFRFSYLIVL